MTDGLFALFQIPNHARKFSPWKIFSPERRRSRFYVPRFKRIDDAYRTTGRTSIFSISHYGNQSTFSGDVLNTTARIQSKCNEMGSLFLISGKLVELLGNTIPYPPSRVGEIPLRGKEKPVELFTLAETN